MASLETDVMKSFMLSCEVIKDVVIQNVHSAAARGELQLTNEQFAKLCKTIKDSVDQAGRNSFGQMQSSFKKHAK